MRAARVLEHGEPVDVVRVEDVAVPEAGDDTVLVEVRAASLNFGDVSRCRGGVAAAAAAPPFTLGMDVCGTVEGRRVVGITQMALGGMAEYALVPRSSLFDAPPELDDAEAAAFLLPFHVSHLALHRRARLAAGETLLVVGGATGVGTAAIALGAAAGARVLATATTEAKAGVCRAAGADVVVDPGAVDLYDVVDAETGGRGAEVVLDLVGGGATEAVWTCVAREGRYVPVGFNDDPESGLTGRPLRKVSMGNFSVVGVLLAYGELPGFRRLGLNPWDEAVGRATHHELLALVAAGTIRPVVGRRIALDDVGAALQDHAERRTAGRTVVEVR